MATFYVKKDEVYSVTATVLCDVKDASGDVIASCSAGETVTFKAPTAKIEVTDGNAILKKSVDKSSSVDVSVFADHVENTDIHVTATEKQRIAGAVTHSIDGTLHITANERETLNNVITHVNDTSSHLTRSDLDDVYVLKNQSVPNAVVITNTSGEITASSIISVSELNTLNDNVSNIKTKLANLESRLAALES